MPEGIIVPEHQVSHAAVISQIIYLKLCSVVSWGDSLYLLAIYVKYFSVIVMTIRQDFLLVKCTIYGFSYGTLFITASIPSLT